MLVFNKEIKKITKKDFERKNIAVLSKRIILSEKGLKYPYSIRIGTKIPLVYLLALKYPWG